MAPEHRLRRSLLKNTRPLSRGRKRITASPGNVATRRPARPRRSAWPKRRLRRSAPRPTPWSHTRIPTRHELQSPRRLPTRRPSPARRRLRLSRRSPQPRRAAERGFAPGGSHQFVADGVIRQIEDWSWDRARTEQRRARPAHLRRRPVWDRLRLRARPCVAASARPGPPGPASLPETSRSLLP
jgi:hypothetical protein